MFPVAFALGWLPMVVLGAAPREIRLEPSRIALANPTASQHYIVSGVATDGAERDLTTASRVLSSDPNVVEIDETQHLIIGKAPGRALIRAEVDGVVKGVAEVKVGNSSSDMSVRFSPDIISILTTKGCNGSACHGSPAGQNGFKLSLFGYNLAADYEMIVKAQKGQRVNLEKPEESLILLQAVLQYSAWRKAGCCRKPTRRSTRRCWHGSGKAPSSTRAEFG